ncbi:protein DETOXIFICATION 42-like isoform X3 [Juglans microcarpa x Juglans regia]|uniref:protein DETOXIFICATION 42-like isoform X3 n=1 Tax=Juglans microcarpa x Juglans regia TaxID=2249226 RepID=UPI001B7DD699|nr:protein DETOXIFICATION 42-like isoform X3 [Juglans microcarpa x Juglans regia]
MTLDAVSWLWKSIGKMPLFLLFKDTRNVFRSDDIGKEIMQIALPTALALTTDPIASIIDTIFIGRIGAVELAAVGVSIAVFNQVSKIAIIPLVSVTTSFVAEEDANERLSMEADDSEVLKKGYAVDLEMEMKELIPQNSPMLKPAQQYLTLRSLGAPAVLLSLAMQGVFRGFKDTKTPLYATVVGDAANIILDPLFMFILRMGVSGAALAHVISQYLISLILLWRLLKEVDLLAPSINDLQFGRFLSNGFMLLVRVIAVTFCVTLAASLAARQGSTAMAAFQVCLQIWLATSLLADGLAVAGQAILAGAFAKKDYNKAATTASRVLQLGLVLGLSLSVIIVGVLQFAPRIFTQDINVLQLIGLSIPFVAVTQPINALAFVFDGINYGASDFAYSAYSMVLVALVSITCLFIQSSSHGFIGIWIALSIYMSLRALAGFWRDYMEVLRRIQLNLTFTLLTLQDRDWYRTMEISQGIIATYRMFCTLIFFFFFLNSGNQTLHAVMG